MHSTAHAAAIETLELFNEKANQLLESEFFNELGGGGAIVEFSRASGWDSVHVGPDDESTRALVLTLRLFVQKRERISLRKMGTLYSSLPISAPVKQQFDSQRSQLNVFLDSGSPLAISDEGPLTYRDILRIFVYGEYAHVDERCRQVYRGSTRDDTVLPRSSRSASSMRSSPSLVALVLCAARTRKRYLRSEHPTEYLFPEQETRRPPFGGLTSLPPKQQEWLHDTTGGGAILLPLRIDTKPPILERAFRGELVPQDPSDEPASAFLERIRAERDMAGSRRNRRTAAT